MRRRKRRTVFPCLLVPESSASGRLSMQAVFSPSIRLAFRKKTGPPWLPRSRIWSIGLWPVYLRKD